MPRREILRQCHRLGRAEHPASEAPRLNLLAAKPPSAKATPVPPSHPAGGFPLLQPQHHFFQLFFLPPGSRAHSAALIPWHTECPPNPAQMQQVQIVWGHLGAPWQ